MTIREAIKELKNEYKYAFNNDFGEAIRLAIQALEKRESMKPTYVDTRFRNHGRSIADGCSLSKCYKCPSCDSHIFKVWDDDIFCSRCGQALDWEE